MTDSVIPSPSGNSNGYIVAQLIQHGASTDGWIQDSASALLADNDADLDQTAVPLNAFDIAATDTGSTPPDVTIDTGEGFVGGAWVARDVTTLVDLADNTTGQQIYAGWDHDATETMVIGTDGAFAAEDPQLHIWTVDTSSGSVSATYDHRPIGPQKDLGTVTTDAGSAFARFLMSAVSSSATGTEGNSTNELWRAPGSSSDLLMSVNADGKMNLAWNCYFDGTDWRYIAGSEPAYRVTFGNGVSLHSASSGTADNVISFRTLTLDTRGMVNATGGTVWDESSDEVPQSSLGGPASSLSGYPVPAGDIADGSGSGLDSDLVDGYHASDLQGGQWTTIDTYTDTDATTTFTYDSGALATTYDLYRVDVVWVNHSSAAEFLELQLNNDGTTNYMGLYVEDASEVYRGGPDTSFRNIGKVGAEQVGQGHLRVRGNTPSSATSSTVEYPTVSADFGGSPSHPHLVSGELQAEHPTVDQLALFSDVNASGKLKLLGMSL